MKSNQTNVPLADQPAPRARRGPWRWGIGAVVVGSLVALVVLATQRASPTATPLGSPAANAPGADRERSSSLQRFSLADVNGRDVTRPSGRKPGVLVFTASYCTPCIAQAPSLVAELRKFGSRAEVLTVSIDPGDSSKALRDAFRPVIGSPRNYPLAWDPSGKIGPAFDVTALGTEIVYDRAGREVWRGVSSPAAEIGAALRKAGAA